MKPFQSKHILFLFAFTTFYSLFHLILFSLSKQQSFPISIFYLSYTVADLVVCLSLLYSFWKSQESERKFWLLLTLAALAVCIGDCIWLSKFSLFPISLPAYISSYYFYALYLLFFLLAFTYKITYHYDRLQKLIILCDTCIIAVVLLTLDYYFILQSALQINEEIHFSSYMQLIYAPSDILLLLIGIRLLFLPIFFSTRKVLYLLIASLLLYSLTDAAYDYWLITQTAGITQIILSLYKISLLMLSFAGAVNEQYELPKQTKQVKVIHPIVPYVGAMVLCIILLIQSQFSSILMFGLFLTFLFILLRQAFIRKQNNKLIVQMQQFTASLEERIQERTILLENQKNEIQYLAFHDTLTALLNRPALMQRLTEAIQAAKAENEAFALLFIDLDRFKVINDTLGHTTGDAVLIEIAKRLQQCMSPTAIPARLGGDEFTILLQGNPSRTETEQLAHTLLQTIQAPIPVGIHTVHTTASIGIAFYPEAGENVISILQNADIAMYASKMKGKNEFSFYDEGMHATMQRRLRLEKDLARALANGELYLLYQPQIDLRTHTIVGFEALLRWQHPELSIISPAEFIPIAEDTGHIVPIGRWMLLEACKQMKKWEPIYPQLEVGVNISAREFRQSCIVELISTILIETGLAPNRLNLELTERIAMEDEEATLQKLKELKELGIRISIDDFGTGYSSLSYLSLYPIDTLKIPRELLLLAEASKEGLEILAVISSLSKALQLSVIVEGVERESQLSLLRQHDLFYIQGYHFSRPLAAAAAEQFLQHFPAHCKLLSTEDRNERKQ